MIESQPAIVGGFQEEILQDDPAILQEYVADPEVLVLKAVVTRVISARERTLPALGITVDSQEIEVQFLEGPERGERVIVTNDYVLLSEGDRLFVRRQQIPGAEEPLYGVIEIQRTGALWVLFGLFALLILGFGGWQGVRSLVSLFASLFIILYLLVPTLVSGYPPILTSIGIASLVLFGAIFFTHGFNKKSLAAFMGTTIAVTLTGLLAWASIAGARFTGLGSDESIYLNVNTAGTLDFTGLLLAGIIIGVLGVLDDIAITQVAVVKELLVLRGKRTLVDIFWRAMRVGREHVASLVNTLVLAYTGAALPLLLWISSAGTDLALEINREMVALEIVRMIVGSIGLIMAVPITTAIAVWLLRNLPQEELEGEFGHSHGHEGHDHTH